MQQWQKGKQVGYEAIERMAVGVFNLCDVLQFVIGSFYQGTFFQESLVRYAHQRIPRFVFYFGYQLYPPVKRFSNRACPI